MKLGMSWRQTVFCTILLAFPAMIIAAPGDLLMEYHASEGTLPRAQGWSLEAQSLREAGPNANDCPRRPVSGQDFECQWMGGEDGNPVNGLHDNDGTIGTGAAWPVNVLNSGGGYVDSVNSPTTDVDFPRITIPGDENEGYLVNYVWLGNTPWKGTESYSEWMEFDDDDVNLHHVATLGQHADKLTPKGAANFPGAPLHQVLRLVGGDGNGVALSLPFVSSFNNQDGQVLHEQSYEQTGVTGTVTVVFRGALSVTQEGEANHAFLLVRAYDTVGDRTVYFAFTWFMPRTFSGGVPICDAEPPTGDCGKFGIVNLQNGTSAQQCAGQDGRDFDTPLLDGSGGGPNLGTVMPNEFFTFRVICDPSTDGGTATIWVNEGTPQVMTGSVSNITYGNDFRWGCKNGIGGSDRRMVRWGLRQEDDATIWVDEVMAYEGAVAPGDVPTCELASQPDPVFDVRDNLGQPGSDGSVEDQDFFVFANCATGPTPDPGHPSLVDDVSNECFCMDVNEDGAIDQTDFATFQKCLGQSGAALAACDDAGN